MPTQQVMQTQQVMPTQQVISNINNITNITNITKENSSIPWVEKYRPKNLNDIVLDNLNRIIIERIIETNNFPNILLYGPPGTGKTTTIINLVNSFQEKYNQKNRGLMIHLNASDERGIDIIRSQIHQFVNSNSLFHNGIKFVILDEVDYMTKNAQQALKYLLQGFNNNVRFCLICNYISRIDESLQNEFMRIRFNQLPESDIINFLSVISEKEQLNIPNDKLLAIQRLFKSDIRSMINYIQSNQYIINNQEVVDDTTWHNLTLIILHKDKEKHLKAVNEIYKISSKYNMEIKNIIKEYFNYIIHFKPEYISSDFLKFTEFIMHLNETCDEHIIKYTVLKTHQLFTL
jgi:DNA polymerase III delta prime subunit